MSLPAPLPASAIVLGMHRSGTSVLGNVLAELGYSVGRSAMPGTEDNARGYFENRELMRLHDEMLFAAGSTWSDPHFIPEGWWNERRLQKWGRTLRSTLAREYAGVARRLIKDPRMCRLLPCWQRVLEEEEKEGCQIRFFLPLRHPGEVAASLSKRDGFSQEYGVMLWLAHVLPAEEGTRKARRLILFQDKLLKGEENSRIAAFLGVGRPEVDEAVHRAVDVGLRHHRTTTKEVLPGHPFGKLASRAWQAILDLGSGKSDGTELEEITAEFQSFLCLVPRDLRGAATTGPSLISSPRARLYLDRGNGFGEDDSVTREVAMEGKQFSVTFAHLPPAIQALRLDPLPGHACRVKILRAESSAGPVSFLAGNAQDQCEGFDRFFHLNPSYAAARTPFLAETKPLPEEARRVPFAQAWLAWKRTRAKSGCSQRRQPSWKKGGWPRPRQVSSARRKGKFPKAGTFPQQKIPWLGMRARVEPENKAPASLSPPAPHWLRVEGEMAVLTNEETQEKLHQERVMIHDQQAALHAQQEKLHLQQRELEAASHVLAAYGLTSAGLPGEREIASISQLFADFGDGFNEEQKLSTHFHTDRQLFVIDFVIPEGWRGRARAWRWDPAEGLEVMCAGVRVRGDSGEEYELTAENAAGAKGDWVIFLTPDPVVSVHGPGLNQARHLRFSGHMRVTDTTVLNAMHSEEMSYAREWINDLKKQLQSEQD